MLRSLREVYRYRNLVGYLVRLDLKVRYRGSILGFLWTLLNPLLLMLVMSAVFSRFGRVSEKSYALFLLSALMVWVFFDHSISSGLTAIIKQRSLLQKIYVPKLVFPVTLVTSNVVNLVFFFAAYLIIASFTSVGIPATTPLLVPVVLMLFVVSLGGALLMATLNVFFRDFTHLTAAIMRALFYLTPIFYSPSMFGPHAERYLRLNPMYYPVIAARDVLYYGVVPPAQIWLVGFGAAFFVLVVGLWAFVRNEVKFIYYA
ncbi:MAG: ABC transporter permease [Myxococcota bacterium]